ncbi:hypothetical protein BB560_004375 [Smittium megazygosporum]|uniref:Uncharacterized protein n=1 Tax=Smittium megazygosporum TaxID=133381 RepID=A0A2T9Z9L3_9FUNG|nr:hypothetical protein BB560_004375 [Smittium megazygosporum]
MNACADLKQKYGSVSNYIKQQTAQLFEASPNKPTFLLRLNDFPYALENDITHYIVWSAVPLDSGSTPSDQVVRFIRDTIGFHAEFLWLVNPPHLRSVPSVYHGHLFVKCPS